MTVPAARLLALLLLCGLASPTAQAQAPAPTNARPGATASPTTADVAKKLAWMRLVYARLLQSRRLPPNEAAGQLLLSFEIHPDGRVTGVVVVKSSGDKSLDAHAASMVRSAGPFAPPPAWTIRGGVARVYLPIRFLPTQQQPTIGAPL